MSLIEHSVCAGQAYRDAMPVDGLKRKPTYFVIGDTKHDSFASLSCGYTGG